MTLIWDVYESCGVFYFLGILFSFVLAIMVSLLATRAATSIRWWHLIAVCLLPLAIGLYGTFEGLHIVMGALAEAAKDVPENVISPEEVEFALSQVPVTAYLGGTLSGVLLAMLASAWCFNRAGREVDTTHA